MSRNLPAAAVAVLSLALAGCPPTDAGPDSGLPPDGCPSGQRAAADATHCEPVLPAGECPAGTMPLLGQDTCQPVGWHTCPSGFEADPSGWGCREVLPEAPCDAGTMAMLGHRDCQSVGWSSCPSGFEKDPSGWGCREVLAAGPCTGATRAALGQTSCQAVGSCTDAFPPATATHFVDGTFTAGQLDATHFATLTAAIAAAPAQAVIAIFPGTYAEGVNLRRPVTLVGRCAAQVNLQVPANVDSGLAAEGFTGTVVRGLTITGGRPGVAAVGGASVRLEDSVLEGSRELGAFTSGAGSSLTLVRTVVRNTRLASDGRYGYGGDAEAGAALHLEDSELFANHLVGAFVQNPGSALTLSRSVVHGTLPDNGGNAGHGLQQEGNDTTLTVDQSVIADNRVLGVFATGARAHVALTDTVVRGTQFGAIGQLAGVQMEGGARLVMQRCALVANKDIALFIKEPGSTAQVLDSVIVDTQPRQAALSGRGVSVQEQASVTLERSAVIRSSQYGLAVGGDGSQLKLVGSLVQGTRRLPGGEAGWGVLAMDAAHLTVEQCAFEDNTEYGLSLARKATVASVTGTVVRGTRRGADVSPSAGDFRVQGIGVQDGAELTLSQSALLGNQQIGLYEYGGDDQGVASRVVATNLVVRGTLPSTQLADATGAGIVVGASSRLVLSSSALVDNATTGLMSTLSQSGAYVSDTVVLQTRSNLAGDFGYGALAQLGGELQLDGCALVGNHSIGLLSTQSGSRARATRVLVQDTQPDAFGSARSAGAQFGAQLDLSQCTLRNSAEVGLYMVGSGTAAHLTDTWLTGTLARQGDNLFGHGVIVDAESQLLLERSQVDTSAGIGVAVTGGAALLSSSFIYRNTVGLHAQNGSMLVVAPASATVLPLQVQVSEDTQVIGNLTRVGSGTVPIPAPSKGATP